MKHINQAFDYETVNGTPVLLTFSDGTFFEYPTIDTFLEKIDKNNRKRRYFTWNLRFDSECFLKELGNSKIEELLNGGTDYRHWHIEYLGKIQLKIKNMKSSRVTYVYDIAQFYDFMTLANASKKYLDKEFHKLDSPVIRDFKTVKNTFEFFEQHKDEIIEYGLMDALSTAKLATRFELACEDAGYNFKTPFSMGNMAMKWIKQYLEIINVKSDGSFCTRPNPIPRIHPTHYKNENERLRFVETTFETMARGGWNDVFKRGKFKNVYDIDIVGAYTSIASKAPYWDGEWDKHVKEDELDGLTYGIVACKINELKYPVIPSMHYYLNETNINDNLIYWKNKSIMHSIVTKPFETLLTLDQYKYLSTLGDIEYQKSVVLKPTEKYKDWCPLEKPVKILAELKQEAKEKFGKQSVERMIPKKMGNSFTGKFKQKMHSNYTWWIYPHLYAHITWQTKQMVMDVINKNKLWDDIISISTDGGTFTKKPSKIDLSGELGSWELVKYKELVQIGNGIYYGYSDDLINEFGNINGYKQRVRGYHMPKLNLRNIINDPLKRKATKVSLISYRPVHLRECFKQHCVEDVNKFKKAIKYMKINQEIKRNWFDKFIDIEDMLSGRIIDSQPWTIHEAIDICLSEKQKAMKKLKEIDKKQKTINEYN